jgi:hypothetical protein
LNSERAFESCHTGGTYGEQQEGHESTRSISRFEGTSQPKVRRHLKDRCGECSQPNPKPSLATAIRVDGTRSGSPPGGGFAFDNACRTLERQHRDIDSLDTKAGLLLAADGVLVGLLAGNGPLLVDRPVGIAGVALVAVSAGSALVGIWPRQFGAAPEPRKFAEATVVSMDEEPDLKWEFIGNVLEAVEGNRPRLTRKVHFLRAASASLLSAIVLLAVGAGWNLAT